VRDPQCQLARKTCGKTPPLLRRPAFSRFDFEKLWAAPKGDKSTDGVSQKRNRPSAVTKRRAARQKNLRKPNN
jgi:hypothetical protein